MPDTGFSRAAVMIYCCPAVLTTVILKAYSRSKGSAATRSTKNQVVA